MGRPHTVDRWFFGCGRWGNRGFTVVELVVVIVLSLVVGLIALVAITPTHNRHPTRYLKDMTQVRGLMSSLVIFSNNNQDRLPLPSLLDASDATIAAPVETKDTTANIFSILVYQGFIPVEMCVSPAEYNGKIKVFDKYSFSSPATAAKPADALWDPAFSADFTSPSGGNFSYGHQIPIGTDPPRWSNTFSSVEAIVGNRGPQIASVTPNGLARPAVKYAAPRSNTFLIHGGRTTWEGAVGFADNHVDFVTEVAPEHVVYRFGDGIERRDVMFFDEPDDPAGRNAYLGMFTTAGAKRGDYTAIWD